MNGREVCETLGEVVDEVVGEKSPVGESEEEMSSEEKSIDESVGESSNSS